MAKSTTLKSRTLHKKRIWLVAIAGILVIALSWWGWNQFSPKPLGDRLKYIGKENYGCWIGFCDSPPSTTYLYATEMTPPELIQYFSKAHVRDKVNDIDLWQDRGASFRIHFFDKNDSRFTIGFNTHSAKHLSGFKLNTTAKPYIIEIESNEYQLAKDSL